jgi:hypothetical protein
MTMINIESDYINTMMIISNFLLKKQNNPKKQKQIYCIKDKYKFYNEKKTYLDSEDYISIQIVCSKEMNFITIKNIKYLSDF